MPFDQALGSAYNNPAKGPGGVIGISRKKEAVLKWNLIKHEKAKYTRFIDDICNYVEKDEYSLHHEFSTITTTKDEQSVQTVCDFFRKRGDIFAGENLTNFVTGEVLDASTKAFFLGCIDRGDKLYNDFRDTRIVKKTSALLDRISKAGIPKAKSGNQTSIDKKKETMDLLRIVDIARARCFSIDVLLSFEVTNTSLFLVKDNFLREASNKSDLLTYIRLKQSPFVDLNITLKLGTFIEFMSYARKLNSRMHKENMKTFGDFVENLWESFQRYSKGSYRLDIVFDNYYNDSVKSGERLRRAEGAHFDQPLPPATELPKFWASTENKVSLQQFFIKWISQKYEDECYT